MLKVNDTFRYKVTVSAGSNGGATGVLVLVVVLRLVLVLLLMQVLLRQDRCEV